MPKRRKKYKGSKSQVTRVSQPASLGVHPAPPSEPGLSINIAAELRKIGLLSGIILVILLVLFVLWH